ncbi:MAG TPA: D-alanyl-D-alanine carboxypeptidase family protein [Alphaproteobacteria bacterium]|nr:D-alanyl-D-alanine carboxypeptidase family protein [Alphaproteobacteria bacterium]
MRLYILTALLITCAFVQPSQAEQTSAKQSYIIDFETGQSLLSKEATAPMPTSSMSKVMTMYMVFDAIKNGVISMDTELPVSEKAWRMGGSKMFVDLGSKITVKDLAQGVIVQSGNDATVVLAEGVSGTEDSFAQKMTEKAHELGMKNSNFVNASGWPDPNHYSTAQDLSILAKAIIKDFPEYYPLFSEKEYTYNNIKQQNRNPLLYKNIGADGLKTGHTEIAGYGLIGTAERDGRRVIVVVNGLESEKDRADESARLINWGLDHFSNVDFVKANTEIDQAPVVMGKSTTVGLALQEDVRLTIPKLEKSNITVDLKYKSPLVAPIKAGQEIGTLTINIPTMDSKTFPLFTTGNVEEVGFFKKTLTKFEQMIFGKS